MSNNNFPSYARPPVAETILGVQFEPIPNLSNAHLGLFWNSLGKEWPKVTDTQTIEPQFEQFEESGNWSKLGIQFKMAQDAASRLQIRNRDNNRMIQVQNGRLHFNWLGQGENKYPRYKKVRQGFLSTFEAFTTFLQKENLGELRPNQWEVTYLNHIPKGTVWNTPEDWNFFLPLSQSPDIELPLESFGGEWHCVIPGQRGRLHVKWNHGKREKPEPKELIILTLTARGPLEDGDCGIPQIQEGLDLGHKVIVESFRNLMSKEANQFWGLKT